MADEDQKKKHATLQQIALVFGVNRRTVLKWHLDFGLPRQGRDAYNLVQVVQWRCAYLEKKIAELQAGGQDGLSARKDYFVASAEMKRFQIGEKKRKLVRIRDVIPVFEDLFNLIISRKKVYGKKTNPQLEGISSPGEREKILDDNLDELFNGVYERGLTQLKRLQTLPDAAGGEPEAPPAVARPSRKRVRRRSSRTQRRNRK